MASQDPSSIRRDPRDPRDPSLQSRLDDLSRQLDAARAQLEAAGAEAWDRCAHCHHERRPQELVAGLCRPCRQIRHMEPYLAKLRTVTEMTVLMAGELSEATGQARHAILDHFEHEAVTRIATADHAVRATRASA